jgi:cation-transporting ATPase 13A2
MLDHYAKNGYRVLAGAYRNVKLSYINLHKVSRDILE